MRELIEQYPGLEKYQFIEEFKEEYVLVFLVLINQAIQSNFEVLKYDSFRTLFGIIKDHQLTLPNFPTVHIKNENEIANAFRHFVRKKILLNRSIRNIKFVSGISKIFNSDHEFNDGKIFPTKKRKSANLSFFPDPSNIEKPDDNIRNYKEFANLERCFHQES